MLLKPVNSKMENFKLIEEKENPLFNRKEVVFEVQAKITPSRTEVEKLISEKFSTQAGNIKIKEIHGKFGSNNFNITSFIYKSEEDKNKIEPKTKKEMMQKTEETVKESTSETKEVKEEKSQEETKDEEKVEDKNKTEEKPSEENKKE